MKPNINSLRRKHSGVLDARQTLVNTALDAGRPLSDEEKVKDDGLKAEAAGLAATITRAEELERELAASARPVDDDGDGAAPVRVQVKEVERPKGYNFAAVALCLAAEEMSRKREIRGKRNWAPAAFAKEVLGDHLIAQRFAAASLTAGVLAEGGALIREDVSADFLEMLTARSVIRRHNPRIAPMPNGQLTINGQSGGATYEWVGENVGAKASAQALRQVKLTAKKLRITCPISNDLIRYAGEQAISFARGDMEMTAALAEDLAFLRGSGTAFTPKGLLNWAAAANKFNVQGSPDLTKVTTDSGKLILFLVEANVLEGNWVWFFAPRTRVYLDNQRDANGNKSWPEIALSRSFRGYPYDTTTQIPKNLGGGANESEIYFICMDDVVVGQAPLVGVRASSEASYKDSGGSLVSAFDRDETVLDLIEEVDLAVRHAESIAVGQAVIWVP